MKILYNIETDTFSNDEVQDGNFYIGFRALPADIEGFTFGFTLLKNGVFCCSHQWPKHGEYIETDQDYVEAARLPTEAGNYTLIVNVNDTGQTYSYEIV